MADFSVLGFLTNVKYLQSSVVVNVSESRNGFKRSDGTFVQKSHHVWQVVFKPYFKRFIAENFTKGELVMIKGEVFPRIGEAGEDGDKPEFIPVGNDFVILGQTINLASYPKKIYNDVSKRMRRESQSSSDESPNVTSYQEEDF